MIPPCGDFIAKAQGHRILQVGAADLDDRHPGLGFGIEGMHQGIQCWQQPIFQLLGRGDMDGSGKHIIGGLRSIDVVIGMHRTVTAEGGA